MIDLTASAGIWFLRQNDAAALKAIGDKYFDFKKSPSVQHLRAGDAAVLASAEYANADVIYTWDRKFMDAVNSVYARGLLSVRAEEPPAAQPQLPIA